MDGSHHTISVYLAPDGCRYGWMTGGPASRDGVAPGGTHMVNLAPLLITMRMFRLWLYIGAIAYYAARRSR
ncbi:hypothetical protein KDAU_13880 [Dictyobacter aurantiacus]|uniref:Uncharacterized protein n=1 Tax=Dictyobacter aurantiacus TaxID=1936993 RepID=A0A401ZB25_9CHLR|nr:hypothetical protein KDAU_13880 [Dictyobacter aurantiacus]